MQLTAKLIQILPLQSGTGRNGEWKKQDIIVETQDQYPKKICVSLWGNKFESVPLNEGTMYTIDFDVESREYNGRWYTDVKAWRIALQSSASAPQQSAPAPQHGDIPPEGPPASNPFDPSDDGNNEVPF